MLQTQKGFATQHHSNSHDPTLRKMSGFRRANGMGTMRIDGRLKNLGHSGGIEFRTRTQSEDESGVSSPPLWKISPPRNPTVKAPHFQQHLHYSPNPQLQAIADGRRELMEMIKDAPESAYELSLKDIVELQTNRVTQATPLEEETDLSDETTYEEKRVIPTAVRTKSNGHEQRQRNVNKGAFLLKMFFPISLPSKKRPSGASMSSKVSPKPPAEGEKVGFEKGADRELWKNQKSVGGDGESSGKSISRESENNSQREIDGIIPGCWSFLNRNNNKAKRLK